MRMFAKRFEKDVVFVCLYDVIGSYPNVADNRKIIRTAYELVRDKGIFRSGCTSFFHMRSSLVFFLPAAIFFTAPQIKS